MTTILAARGIMMADRQATDGNGAIIRLKPFTKMRKMPDGSVVGVAGNLEDIIAVLDWFEAGKPDDGKPEDLNIDGLMLTKDGDAYRFQDKLKLYPVEQPIAVGTGGALALGALAAGASLPDAMKVAGENDAYTSLENDFECVASTMNGLDDARLIEAIADAARQPRKKRKGKK